MNGGQTTSYVISCVKIVDKLYQLPLISRILHQLIASSSLQLNKLYIHTHTVIIWNN